MKTIRRFTGVLITTFLSVVAVGLSQAQVSVGQTSLKIMQEPLRQSPDALAATEPVSSTFSYQGVLKENGAPVTGNRQMIFRLYADDGCSAIVGSPMTHTVPVDKGLFHVTLSVNPSDFNGQALWLETDVGGVSVACQTIQAVPYALSLRPGAIIGPASEDVASITALSGSGTVTDVHPGGAYLTAAGEFAGSNGIIGAASSDTPLGIGVAGFTQGDAGVGVYGWSRSDSGTNYGVYGRSNSADGYAGYFENTGGGADIRLGGSGSVVQTRTGNGMIKAAVYAYCAGNTFTPQISRSFNTVNSATFSIYAGTDSGECIIDFNFQVSDRFWAVSADRAGAFFASCTGGASNDRLECGQYNYNGGSPPGYIMVLIY
ncbi:MAG: hypothetical protein JXA21_02645 [Anaerolineae bacterium]|nr:hypothetical protein [Anaerolineae bacterium]